MEKLLQKENYTFCLVKPQENIGLREQYQALRYNEFTLKRGTEPDRKDCLEMDLFDIYSTYILFLDRNDQVKGGCRIIPFQKRIGLPILKVIDRDQISTNSLEISRLIAPNADLKSSLYVLIHRYALEKGYERIYALARAGLIKCFQKEMALALKIIGEPIKRKSLTLVPISIDPLKIMSNLDL